MLGTDLLRALSSSHDTVGIDLDEVDISNRDATRKQFQDRHPHLVINAAAFTDVDGCEKRVDDAFRVNAQGVENVAFVCRELGIRLIHVSTDYVFDGKSKIPYREDAPTNPLGVYGQSKLEGENRARRILPETCIVRTAWLYGKAGRNFVEAILGQAEKETILKVVDDQQGSPTYTKDLAIALKVLAEKGLTGVFHVTNQGACSWYDFAGKILELAGRTDVQVLPISTGELGRQAPRPASSVLNCTNFESATGMKMREWPDALNDYLTG